MKILRVSREITVSILVMIALIWGLSGISYGQAPITGQVDCEVSNVVGNLADVTVKGTIRANRDVTVKVWLAINKERIGPTGGHSLGKLSEGQTKSFSITERRVRVFQGASCGADFEWTAVNPPPQVDPPSTDPTPQPGGQQPGGATYSRGKEILTLPTGFWTPDLTSGGSFSIIGGKVIIELRNGGLIKEDGITYTCVAGGGCTIEDRRVTRGTIQATGGETPPQPAPQPDLVIQSIQSNEVTVAPGESFTLSVSVKNNGDGRASSTTLRYYRSTNATISLRDTEVGTDSVSALQANRTGDESISLTAPTSPGTYYYGVCVDSVTNERDTDNNCSTAVSVTVTAPPVVSGPRVLVIDPDVPPIYWTDNGTDKIQHVNLDGSNVEDLVTRGLTFPSGVALDVVGGKMYWTDFGTDKIQQANLDGSNVQDLVTRGLDNPHGIALDVVGGKMYWTDYGTDKIQRANLDGSNIEDLVTRGLTSPSGIALDVVGGKMYWTDVATEKIQRANLNGSNVEDLVTQGLRSPFGITLDVVGGKMYWTDVATEKIQRANLNGSNVEDLVTQGLNAPWNPVLDIAGGKMYWTHTEWNPTTEEFTNGKIQRANLNGSNVEDVIIGLNSLAGIALGIPAAQQPAPQPDLVVEAAQAVPATVAPGETFKLYATLKNQGATESAATTVRYYRSTDRVITTRDTQLSRANRNPLAPNATIRRYLIVTAPTAPGTYYYGVCVDSVTNESDTANNCSAAVSVTVTAPPVVAEDVNDDGVVDVQDLVVCRPTVWSNGN